MAVADKILFKIDFDKLTGRLLAALILLTLAYNMAVCWRVYRAVPLREGASRSLLAANSRFFYDSGLAEPLPVFALKAAMFLGAEPDAALRAEGLAVFAAITALTLVVLWRSCGIIAAMTAALLVAASPYMGYYAMQGDSHLYALFFLLLFWHYFDPAALNWRRAAWAGLYGGLACLSRLDCAWFIFLTAGLLAALNFRRFNFRAAGLALGLALTLVAPYLIYQRVQYKNSLYSQELSLRRWANIDKRRHNYSGPLETGPLSVSAFILRDGVGVALQRSFSGLGHSLSYEVPKVVYYKLIIVFIFLGFYAAFIMKKDALLVFSAAAFLPALALAPIGEIFAAGGITLRYYLWTLWSLCALAGLGLQELLGWIEKQLDEYLQAGPGKAAQRQ